MWKEVQNRLRSPDAFVSLLLGVAVVLVMGTLVYNYVTKRGQQKVQETTEKKAEEQIPSLPTTHTVTAGETLWTIAERYYKSGYNWVDIQKENSLANADAIEVGQTLTIPNATPIFPPNQITATATEAKPQTYTVVRGDTLWDISMRFYNGDGYQWVRIAQINKLANPDLIHAGNVLTLP